MASRAPQCCYCEMCKIIIYAHSRKWRSNILGDFLDVMAYSIWSSLIESDIFIAIISFIYSGILTAYKEKRGSMQRRFRHLANLIDLITTLSSLKTVPS